VGAAVGDTLTVTARPPHSDERGMKWIIGSRDEVTYELKDVQNVSALQHARRAAWLKGEAEN
jgi:hypothetical protein